MQHCDSPSLPDDDGVVHTCDNVRGHAPFYLHTDGEMFWE